MNRATLIGRLGKDAETKTVGDAIVITFTLATSEKYRDRNGDLQEKTEWHSIEYWRKDGKLAEYLKKGTQVAVEGQIRNEEYEKDGQKKYITKIRVRDLELLGSRNDGDRESAPEPRAQQPERKPLYQQIAEQNSLAPQDQDLPF